MAKKMDGVGHWEPVKISAEEFAGFAKSDLESAKYHASTGNVNSAVKYLADSKHFAELTKNSALEAQIHEESKTVLQTAYENGVEFKLGGVKKALDILKSGAPLELGEENLVLNAYTWLKEAEKYAEKGKIDIKHRVESLNGELNSFDLQKYLAGEN